MPIRINLLAEAQEAEDARRRDPAKRAAIVAGVIVGAVAAWSGSLQFKVMRSNRALEQLEAKWKGVEKTYLSTVDSRRQSLDVQEKLTALTLLTSNRFLWGTALNAMQQTLAGADDVHIVRFKSEQNYVVTEESRGRANDPKSFRPATSTEKISLIIEAVDASAQTGSHVSKFKDNIATQPWFQNHLAKTNAVLLTSLSPPQMGPAGQNAFVTFTLNCSFPDKVR